MLLTNSKRLDDVLRAVTTILQDALPGGCTYKEWSTCPDGMYTESYEVSLADLRVHGEHVNAGDTLLGFAKEVRDVLPVLVRWAQAEFDGAWSWDLGTRTVSVSDSTGRVLARVEVGETADQVRLA